MKFKALINGVHYDPKKGSVKIVLVGASHVSPDELTTLSPNDETIRVTLESEQTKLDDTLTPYGVALEPGSREEREAKKRSYHDPDDVPPDGLPVDEGEEGDSKHESEEKEAEVEGGGEED